MPIDGYDSTGFEQQAAESILGDIGLRDELTDSEAQPLIDWAMAQVKQIVQQQGALPQSPEALDDSLRGVQKIMKRVNKIVGLRAEGDPERMAKGLDQLASLSERIYGPAAPSMMMGQADRFLAEEASLTNEQVIERLLAMVSPPVAVKPPQESVLPEPPPIAEVPDPLDVPAASELLAAPPAPDRLTAPPKPVQIDAPETPEQLGAPPKPGQLTAPEPPDRLTAPPKPLALDGPPEPSYDTEKKDEPEHEQ